MSNPTMNSGLNGNTSAQINDGFITAQNIFQALKAEERDTYLFNPYGNNSVSGWFAVNALEENVGNTEFTHAEDVRSTESYSLSLGSAGTAEADTTVTIETGSRYSHDRSFYGNSNATATVAPRPKEVLVFPGGIEGYVKSVNTSNNTMVVKPTQAGEAIPVTTAADKVISLGLYSEEGGGSPDPWSTRQSQFKNYLSISVDAIELTELAESQKMVIKGSDGQPMGWSLKNHVWTKKLEDFHNKLDARMFAGKRFTNTSLIGELETTPSGNGYFSYIDNFGKTIGYSGSLALADFDKALTNASEIGAPKEYTVTGAISSVLAIADMLNEKAGNASFLTYGGNKQKATDLNNATLKRANYTLHVVDFPVLTNPEILGPEYRDRIVFLPTAGTGQSASGRKEFIKVKCLDGKDGFTNGYLERMRSGIHGSYVLDNRKTKLDVTAIKGIDPYGQKVHMQLKKS